MVLFIPQESVQEFTLYEKFHKYFSSNILFPFSQTVQEPILSGSNLAHVSSPLFQYNPLLLKFFLKNTNSENPVLYFHCISFIQQYSLGNLVTSLNGTNAGVFEELRSKGQFPSQCSSNHSTNRLGMGNLKDFSQANKHQLILAFICIWIKCFPFSNIYPQGKPVSS